MRAPECPASSGRDNLARRLLPSVFLGLLTIVLASAGFSLPAGACRYNVRDVGFVDLDPEPYHLYCFVRHGTPLEITAAVTNAAMHALLEGNVVPELVDLEAPAASPAARYAAGLTNGIAPSAVLVSPDGQVLPCALPPVDERFAKAAGDSFRALLDSPLRTALTRAVSHAYGVILLIEGTEPSANREARTIITNAIDQVRQQMRTLPKAIDAPPVLVSLEPAAFERERTLLWSLRLTPEPTTRPRAVVLFGRARWIGPLMQAAEITERNLVGIFSIIGADCECGLDLAWTQGTRLPVRWDAGIQAATAKGLGFDPENPLVKSEVSGILGRRVLAPARTPARPESPPPPTTNRTLASAGTNAPVALPWLALGTIAVLALAGGTWIAFRAARRN